MPSSSKASPHLAGGVAPSFDLASSEGRNIQLADFAGKQTVVLYFYPKADTPGCTKQACGFRDAAGAYANANVAVLGISPDPAKKVTKFAEKFSLSFPLLADADHAVAEAYGVWGEKKFMGRTYLGVARTTFVIGPDGTIRYVFRDVKPEGHDAEVLKWIELDG